MLPMLAMSQLLQVNKSRSDRTHPWQSFTFKEKRTNKRIFITCLTLVGIWSLASGLQFMPCFEILPT